jgi:hypothetical protein
MKRERADPREVQGKQALFVVNLEPRAMAGRVSEGMLLDIGYADGLRPVLAVPERSIPNGTRSGWPRPNVLRWGASESAPGCDAGETPWIRAIPG